MNQVRQIGLNNIEEAIKNFEGKDATLKEKEKEKEKEKKEEKRIDIGEQTIIQIKMTLKEAIRQINILLERYERT